jgi:branched-chain amino acid transport system substrate-binding protein
MALAYTMVDVLKQAGRDLTRERLMQVVENITETDNPFVLPGVTVRTTPTDHFPVTQMALGEHNGVFDPSGTLEDTRSDLRKLAGS